MISNGFLALPRFSAQGVGLRTIRMILPITQIASRTIVSWQEMEIGLVNTPLEIHCQSNLLLISFHNQYHPHFVVERKQIYFPKLGKIEIWQRNIQNSFPLFQNWNSM